MRKYKRTIIKTFTAVIVMYVIYIYQIRTTHVPNVKKSLDHQIDKDAEFQLSKEMLIGPVDTVHKNVLNKIHQIIQELKDNQQKNVQEQVSNQMKHYLETFKEKYTQWLLHGKNSTSESQEFNNIESSLFEYNQKLLKIENQYRNDSSNDKEIKNMFPKSLSAAVTKMKPTRITGFQYCTILNNAIFNPWIRIHALKGSLMTSNPPAGRFCKLIDFVSTKISESIHSTSQEELDYESVKRFSCYMAVHGNSMFSAISDGMLLSNVDPRSYFPMLNISANGIDLKFQTHEYDSTPLPPDAEFENDIVEGQVLVNVRSSKTPPLNSTKSNVIDRITNNATVNHSKKPRFKMAYLILAHENFESLSRVIDALVCEESIILIHIDKKSADLQDQMKSWLTTNQKELINVHLMDNPFSLQWGSSSIVFAQLQGYYQLLDLADWDYVINLSAYDYPMMSPQAMHLTLELNKGKSYIDYWKLNNQTMDRLNSINFITKDTRNLVSDYANRQFPWSGRFQIYKHHQWMTLCRDFVIDMRKSQETYDLLAFMEHSQIPDEMFFAILGLNPEFGWSDRIEKDIKRFIYFIPGEYHPITIQDGDEDLLENSNIDYFFARKIDSHESKDIRIWMDGRRDDVDIKLGIKAPEEIYEW